MPTPAENGRTILDIYEHFHSRAGQLLRSNNFVAIADRRRIPISDIQTGLEYAAEAGWIEQTAEGFLRLTLQGEQALGHVA